MRIIALLIASIAITFGIAVDLAAQVYADPTPHSPYGGLSCNCRVTAPASPAQTAKIRQGLHDGLAARPVQP